MKTFRKLLSWLCLVPGILMTIYGITLIFRTKVPDEIIVVDDYCYHEENEGKYVAMVGTLSYDTDTRATDEDFYVSFDSPGVKRIISMYQWYKDGYGHLQHGWSSMPCGYVEGPGGIWYHNGSVPDGLQLGEDYLTVPMTMEDGNLQLDDYAVRWLCYNHWDESVNDYTNDAMVEVNDLPETDNAYGFISTGSYYMSSKIEEIGTIRVSYSYLDFDKIKDQVYTISGIQKSGCIKKEIFTDKAMTVEEMKEKYSEMRTDGWIAATAIGLILLASGFAGFFHFRNQTGDTGKKRRQPRRRK